MTFLLVVLGWWLALLGLIAVPLGEQRRPSSSVRPVRPRARRPVPNSVAAIRNRLEAELRRAESNGGVERRTVRWL